MDIPPKLNRFYSDPLINTFLIFSSMYPPLDTFTLLPVLIQIPQRQPEGHAAESILIGSYHIPEQRPK